MTGLIRACLRFRLLVVFAGLALAVIGAFAVADARYDVFPEFGQPTVSVETSVPGLAPPQIEGVVTTPVEDVLAGLPGLASLRSQSAEGLSVVDAVFHGGTDVYRDRELVAARLGSLAGVLPPDAVPMIAPLQSSTGTVLTIGLTAPKLSLMHLTEIARWTIRPALLAVPGVSVIAIYGARPEQMQVQFDPAKMTTAGIGLTQLTTAAAKASEVRGAGVIDTPNQRLVLLTEGQTKTASELSDSLLARRGPVSLTLGTVARVTQATAPPVGGALVGTEPGLMLVIGSQYGANTLAVTQGLDHALALLAPALQADGVIVDADALRPAAFITTALRHVRNSLAIGAALILMVLFLALRNWRTAVVSFAAIPLSLLIAAWVLNLLGFSLNTLSLGGLAIALGEVVDDAVVDVENIHRRLRENRARTQPEPALGVVLRASLEVRSSIIFATVAVVLVFLPVLNLSGVAGRLFAPLAIAYIVAIFASLIVALTLTPAFAMLLLGRTPLDPSDPPLVARAKRGYGRLLDRVDRHPRPVMALIGLLVIAGFASTPWLDSRFLPRFNANDLIVHYHTAPGTSLAATLAVGRRASAIMARMPEVEGVAMHAGRADLSNEHAGVNKGEMDVALTPSGSARGLATETRILDAISGAPGVRWSANTFLAERINETLSGTVAPVVVTIHGHDLGSLDQDGERVAAALRAIPGAAGVAVEAPPGTPELSIALDRAALTRFGFTAGEVLAAIQTSYAGQTVGRVYTGGRSFPIVVVLPPGLRADPAALDSIPLVNATGRMVRLGALARVRETSGQSVILHRDAQRVQLVTANVSGGGSRFVALARPRLASLRLEPGDYLALGGTASESGRARTELWLRGGLAMAAILALLFLALRDARSVALLLANLPFALVGGIAALWIVDLPVSIGAAVGFVTVFGITLRNALMLLSHYRTLVIEEGLVWSAATAQLGAMHRLAPILITALVTALGLLPLAAGAGLAGQEIEGPMAIVILGGLCSSTALTLLVLPTLAARFGHFGARVGADRREADALMSRRG